MVDFINISLADGSHAVIFTKHIAYIERSERGTNIHVSCGQQNVVMVTRFSLEELLRMINPIEQR